THYMEEADLLCDRIGIIDKGKIIALDSPLRLKESIGGDSIKIQVSPNSNLNSAALKDFDFIRKVEFVNDGRVIILSVQDAIHNLPLLLKNANNVDSVEYSVPTLNDVFLQLTGKHMAKEEHSEGGFMERYAQYGK
ncbi:MAG: ABC transporter ATP-binding protein, partial [Candidatus Nitrosopolaris sp.]